ncbi:predicted protein [Sclerotinia sclerotiorum 1980 UF-70]|uniref:Uncharacterized protein n=1 Tax=Sclerotinia sclerotiorum (strain ATCC 18683 / 1980 / Ss-1) TaxID=665079 RepID=A7EQ76_SCLS1|nr:predicted protein [Sclerotinia sclerotiorum 1980 UF-70]EDO04992.1 predicted protein [Sclerotinia sclerotiorum 1980 UF-70]
MTWLSLSGEYAQRRGVIGLWRSYVLDFDTPLPKRNEKLVCRGAKMTVLWQELSRLLGWAS